MKLFLKILTFFIVSIFITLFASIVPSTVTKSSGNFGEFTVDEVPWYTQNKLVAHALGSVDGRDGTNSLEAFLESYNKGHRIMEVDLNLTTDDILVARHDFEQNSYYVLDQAVLNNDTSMDINRFESEKINYKYTSLTMEDLLILLTEYKDVYFITDSKEIDSEIIKKQFQKIVDLATNLDCLDVLDRIIVQIYNEEMLFIVGEIYNFKNYIFTLYQIQNPDFDAVGKFCNENNIPVVTISSGTITEDVAKTLISYDIVIYVHTVNNFNPTKFYIDFGCHGVYTDLLTPMDLKLIDEFLPINFTTKFFMDNDFYDVETYNIYGELYVSFGDIAQIFTKSADKDDRFNVNIDYVDNIFDIEFGKKYIPVGNELSFYYGTQKPKGEIITVNSNKEKFEIKTYSLYREYFISFSDLEKILNKKIEMNVENLAFQFTT